MTRHTALTLLLRCLHDLDYSPPTWTGQLVQRQARAGEGPTTRIACATCNGEGQKRKRGVPFLCAVCAGRGWIVVDGYTHRPIGTSETGLVTRTVTVKCDACGGHGAHGNGRRCGVCRGGGVVEIPVERYAAVRHTAELSLELDGGTGDPILAAFARKEKAGDFVALGRALGSLRMEYRSYYRTVIGVYVLAEYEPEDVGGVEGTRLCHGLGYLLERMPAEIRVPSWAARNERRRREKLKRKRREETAA